MKKEYAGLNELIKDRLSKDEDEKTLLLIGELGKVKEQGRFTKAEFLKMCRWKSPRPLPKYESNAPRSVKAVSEKVFASDSEQLRMELLTSLNGVGIPVASAILTLTDPERYGVIDTRVWQLLYFYDMVSTKPLGRGFSVKDWLNYLAMLRSFAQEFNVGARRIEKTLFEHHLLIAS